MENIGKVVAKRNIRILMEGDRFSNFIKGKEYRYLLKDNVVYLIDEDKMGFFTEIEDFEDDFEFVENV